MPCRGRRAGRLTCDFALPEVVPTTRRVAAMHPQSVTRRATECARKPFATREAKPALAGECFSSRGGGRSVCSRREGEGAVVN